MNAVPPCELPGDGAATATLERDTLQYWFASLGQAHRAEPAGPRAATVGETTPDRRCPHPDRCRFAGCDNDCHSPLPAA